jgi:hypothetical protein
MPTSPLAAAGASTVPAGIMVDPAALRRTGAQLTGLASTLDAQAGRQFNAGIDDPLVEFALNSVQADWSRKRHTITAFLRAAGAAAHAAAEAYEQVERVIQHAAGGAC